MVFSVVILIKYMSTGQLAILFSLFVRVSLRIQSKCGKMRTRITPDTHTFYDVNANKLVKKSVKFLWFKDIFMNVRPISTRELQPDLIFKENENLKCNQIPLSSQTPETYFENSTHLHKIFSRK